MKYKLSKNKIEITGKNDFNIEHILECGQVFSYLKNDKYIVFSGNYKCEIIEGKNGFDILTKNPEYFENYFDLKTNYSEIKNKLNSKKIMQKPIDFGYGIRILKQDLFETLISFIVSANNNIKRIKMILFKLREKYGSDMGDYFAFPTREQLLAASVEDFKNLGAGYRSEYLYKVLRQIDDNTLDDWKKLETKELREKLISLSGVGPKVADCVLLFGYGKSDVFPVDTWIAQMYEKFYHKEPNREIIRKNLINEFGNLSGYAQQYLFYYMRA